MDPAQLSRAPFAQRDTPGLRLAVDTARALGQWRPDHRAEAHPSSSAGPLPGPDPRGVLPSALSGFHRAGEHRRAGHASLPVRTKPAQPVVSLDVPALLLSLWTRPDAGGLPRGRSVSRVRDESHARSRELE